MSQKEIAVSFNLGYLNMGKEYDCLRIREMSSDVTRAMKFPKTGSSSSLMNLHSSFTPLVFHAVAFLVRTPWRHLTPIAPTQPPTPPKNISKRAHSSFDLRRDRQKRRGRGAILDAAALWGVMPTSIVCVAQILGLVLKILGQEQSDGF